MEDDMTVSDNRISDPLETGSVAAPAWDPAPLDQDSLANALLPFGRSTMLPAAAYTSDAVLAWERRNLVAGTWACLGRTEDVLGDSVTQRAVMAGDIQVLVTRDAVTGVTTALANTCRHRGHELLPRDGSATTSSIVCPYHAWSYRLDGSLRAAPGFRDNADFAGADHGLVPLPLVEWHGWLFVNATGNAVPFAEHIGALDDLIAPYAPESLVVAARHTYEIAANWKLVVENYHECYHCPMIHPELCQVSVPTSGDNFDLPGAWVGGTMDFKGDAVTMSLDGTSHGRPIPTAPQQTVLYAGMFPNLLISGHPDYVMAHRMVPLAPDRTWVECTWLFPGEDIDPSYAVDFWDITNREDWGACESVQRGLASPHFKPGPFAPSEDAVHQWVTMLARAYTGIAPHI
jgi:Rieske 2Fe-2S family protein